tara:strand:+ start:376 stop:528 length:153 start_codon:yes stop_codon:yes gene_type:complete
MAKDLEEEPEEIEDPRTNKTFAIIIIIAFIIMFLLWMSMKVPVPTPYIYR